MQQAIFDGLIGRSGAKAILRSALKSGEVDVLLEGPPSSGKSAALIAIEEAVPGARYLDSAGVSERKLRDLLSEDPPILLLDEIDDMDRDAYNALSIAMAHGRVVKDVHGEFYDETIDTQVFAASNDASVLPSHIRSRFQVVEFGEYDKQEYLDVCAALLPKSVAWINSPETAREAAEAIFDKLDSKDIRDARDAARLATGLENLREVTMALRDPTAKVESEPVTRCDILTSRINESDGDSDSEIQKLVKECME